MKTTTPKGYLLDALKALYWHHPQGVSTMEMRQHITGTGIPQAIAGLRNNHGFRHCLVTETIKRTDAPSFGRYRLTDEGFRKAGAILAILESLGRGDAA